MKPEYKITLLHPSRGRSKMAFEAVNEWSSKATNSKSIQYILSIDEDEPDRIGYEGLIGGIHGLFGQVGIVVSKNKNVVEAANNGALLAKGGVIVLMSDDFSCCENWDTFIIENIDPEKEEALQINDGAWPEHRHILTLPIITKKLYDKLGYIYPNMYEGWGADNDLGEHCHAMGILKKNYIKPFIHRHWRLGTREKDGTDSRHDTPEKAMIGNDILTGRRKRNFDI